MILPKKKFDMNKIKRKQLDRFVFEYLKAYPNRLFSRRQIIHKIVKNYYSNYKRQTIIEKWIGTLVHRKKELKMTKTFGYNYITYHKKIYDIKVKNETIFFSHPKKGTANYNLKTKELCINGKKRISTIAYFSGYSCNIRLKDSNNYTTPSEFINFDLVGHPLLEFIRDVILRNINGFTRMKANNFGNIFKEIRRIENTYNWYSLGFRVDRLISYNIEPNIISKNERNILLNIKPKITITSGDIIKFMSENNKTFREIVNVLEQESIDNDKREWNKILQNINFYELVEIYNYTPKSLIRYLFNYIIPYENLSIEKSLNLLCDYASIHESMNIKKFKKHPKYLVSKHDIIAGEFNLYKKDYEEEVFKTRVRKELEFEKKLKENVVLFVVKAPETTEDIKFEGKELNHCVGSYIDRIMEGKTQILFLREEPDKPLVTLEVRKNVLIQAKGDGNRNINKKEMSYIQEYAKNKKLLVRV